MHTETASLTRPQDPVGPWDLLAGASVGIVVGIGIDLWRRGVHEARRARASRSRVRRSATRGWPCHGPCDAGAR